MARITVFALEQVDPPIHGFRVDVSRRLQLMARQGHQVQLVIIARSTPVEFEVSGPTPYAAQQVLIGRRGEVSALGALAGLIRWPWPMACRQPTAAVQLRLCEAVDDFAPQAIWLEGLYTAPWAQATAGRLGLPMFYRSHNVEHEYMLGQWRAERSLVAKFRLLLCLLHLRAVESRVFHQSRQVFDISATDAQFWREQGVKHISWLPPLSAAPATASATAHRWQLGYFGNLNAPNNVEAIEWLINEVMPRVWRARQDARLVIAGSEPTAHVRQCCASDARIELVADPVSMGELYRQTQVLVNPALRGSGVNLKTIDMIASNQPMVVTSVGAGGLPPELVAQLAAPPGPQAFADKIVQALSQSPDAGGAGTGLVHSLNELAAREMASALGAL